MRRRWPGFKRTTNSVFGVLASPRLAHKLARQMGCTVARLDRTMSVAEYINWVALFIVESREEAELAKEMARS